MKQTARKGSYMNVEIAQRLAEMRRAKGYSQEELAEKLGLSRQAVSKWERAESSPDTGNIIALAKLYGVTIDELLRVDEDVLDDVAFESRDRAAADAPPSTVRSLARAEPARPRPLLSKLLRKRKRRRPLPPRCVPLPEAACPQAPGCRRRRPGFVPPEYGAPTARGPQPSRSRRIPPTSKRPTNIPLPRSRRKPPTSKRRANPSRRPLVARRRHPRSASTAPGRRFPTRSFASLCSCWPGSSCRHGIPLGWCSSPYLCITG